MADLGSLALRRWIRELILGPGTLSSPRAGQLLEVLQEPDAPGPSWAPDAPDSGAELLVSDGTHSVRCLVTREALSGSCGEEFGFRGAEGRLVLLQDCAARVRVHEESATAEFYLQVHRFSLLPMEQRPAPVRSCNQDPDVRKKLYDCLAEHLSESTSLSAGPSLSQLLDDVQEDQDHRGALVHLAESCLMLAGPCTAPCLTRWAALRHRTMDEAVYTVPTVYLCISESEQRILSCLDRAQRPQGKEDWSGPNWSTWGFSSPSAEKPPLTARPELPPSDSALQDLSLTLISSSSSSSGTPALSSHALTEESEASASLLTARSSATPSPTPLAPRSPHLSSVPDSLFFNCPPSFSPLGHVPSPYRAQGTRTQKSNLECKELGLPGKNWHSSRRAGATKEASASSPAWDPPRRHGDGSAFQYAYDAPGASLCAQVQAVRLPPQLVAWALHLLMEPEPAPTPP
ncbi:adrenocortical dysplasia protein homolog [Talpa occidentalis]|uniref:adrenocortical dysplasia protein homolog n=1 Tax=Talpa occidentalis TaxID=50954 RepID=UPI00188E1C91|nr:adrenocortical dysplasia protein homolog [Talpa occidentalis]